jgi:hypothetical protein
VRPFPAASDQRPPEAPELADELARIAVSADASGARAGQVLQALAEVMEFDAAWLAVRDPERRRHVPMATAGDGEPLRRTTITALAAHALRTGLRIPASCGTSVTRLTDA